MDVIQNLCPERPSLLGITTSDGKDAWRQGQRETIDEIVKALYQHKYVLANIPTGGGKTLVGAAVQKLLGGDALACTHTIALQEQYRETMTWAKVVTGKSNWPCGRPPEDSLMEMFKGKLTAEECDTYAKCEEYHECSYRAMLAEACESPQVISNYAYAVRILQAHSIKPYGYNPFRRRLLIADEGHLLEDAIIDATTVTLWAGPCTMAGTPPWPQSNDIWTWIAWANDSMEVAQQYAQAMSRNSKENENPGTLKAAKSAASLYATVLAIRKLPPTEWVPSIVGGKQVDFRPLWGWSVSNDRLFQHFEKVLIMSATLGDPNDLMARLDIPPEDAVYLDVPSTFPVANRPVFYWPIVKVNWKTTTEEWRYMAEAISHIANLGVLKDKKGLIHTGSYKVVKALQPYIQGNPRFIFHDQGRGNREELIERLKYDRNPIVVLSPALATGIDIREIGWQIIPKVPYGDLGNPIVKARKNYKRGDDVKFGERNYLATAMNNVVQAAGRAVRAPDDIGVTYILDSSYMALHARVHSPSFYRDAFRWLKT